MSSSSDPNQHASGSTAGAGSGDFHTYRNGRRIEQDRLNAMEDELKQEKEVKEYEDRVRIQKAQEILKLAKNQQKRLKRKRNQQNNKAKKKQKTEESVVPFTEDKMVKEKGKEKKEEKTEKHD